jgi:hypothetical protein
VVQAVEHLPSTCKALSSNSNSAKKKKKAWAWWLTPVILATQEDKMERIMVRGQSRQKIHEIHLN